MQTILLIRFGGLGDLLAAFPSIYLLRKTIPQCSITLICREEYGVVLNKTHLVDEVLSVGDPYLAPLFRSHPYADEAFIRWQDKFSLILGWMQGKKSAMMEENLRSSGRRKCRFFVFEPDMQQPISQFFFQKTGEFLSDERKSIPSFSECTALPLDLNQKRSGLRLLGEKEVKEGDEIVIIHPGSGSERKCWPVENFFKIMDRFSQRRMRGVLVTGEAEQRIERELEREEFPRNWLWLKNAALLKLAGLLSCSSYYLGNDSGVTHLASACGTKGLALFRKDLEPIWRPYGNISVLAQESVSDIKIDSVWETISSSF